ncbi:MAG: response regulator transcription factor [Ignavibacteria bacterium]|nr:response regulator transcription factor [Ignavibacteria bacterium]
MKKKILIAEDEQLHRFYLKRDIERERADIYEVVGEAANGIEMLKLWKQLSPDIIIADLKMPIFSGGEAIREIRRTDTLVKIIVLTSQEEKYLLEALNPFVDAYLFKSKEKPEDILDKLDEVAGLKQEQTRKYVTSLLFEEEEYSTDISRQVVDKLRKGASNKEIAADLKFSPKYVEKILTELFKKHKVKNRVEFVAKINELKEF